MDRPKIVVCIPTYRRAQQLAALLEALRDQAGVEPFTILIGNNDATSIFSSIDSSIRCALVIEEIFVGIRGVVAVRNAMIDWVLGNRPETEWLAGLDDDQLPSSNWLNELVRVGRTYQADIVGGPVRQVPAAKTFWSMGAISTDYLPKVEGSVEMLNEAGNLLLSVSFLRNFRRPTFDPAFGESGGEDYEFFLQARKERAAIFWSPNSKVSEVIPHKRLTFRGLVWRAYSTGAYQTHADLLHGPLRGVIWRTLGDIVRLPAALARVLLRTGSLTEASSFLVRRAAALLGKIRGLGRGKMKRYGYSDTE